MSLTDARESIATALATIPNLRATTYLTDQINPPPGGGFAMIEFGQIDDLVFGGTKNRYPLNIKVFAPRSSERVSQMFFDTVRDPHAVTGIKPVLEANAGVLAACDYLYVNHPDNPSVVAIGSPGVEYLMLEFEGEVVL